MVYTPLFTTAVRVYETSGKKVDEDEITDTFLEDGEGKVISYLKDFGIKYIDIPGDDGTEGDWENNRALKRAASYGVLCIMRIAGVDGATPASGPITGVSVDGMSKSFGKGQVSKSVESPSDWCELFIMEMESLVKDFRTGDGSASRDGAPTASVDNALYNRSLRRYRRYFDDYPSESL